MGNVKDIKGWISSIHGPTDLVISDHRPVPLKYVFALKQGIMPLFRDPNSGPGTKIEIVLFQIIQFLEMVHVYISKS
tara:strand:- start:642 stop:872 length:231 start_codon:yes stop_codon:yes gene_type:complete